MLFRCVKFHKQINKLIRKGIVRASVGQSVCTLQICEAKSSSLRMHTFCLCFSIYPIRLPYGRYSITSFVLSRPVRSSTRIIEFSQVFYMLCIVLCFRVKGNVCELLGWKLLVPFSFFYRPFFLTECVLIGNHRKQSDLCCSRCPCI